MRRPTSAWTATASMPRCVRHLTEIPIGKQGIGFDRLELDAWVDDYIARNGRPARKGVQTWDANNTRPRPARRDLAHRQAHLRAESLPEHWHSSARGSGTIPRESDGTDAASPSLWRQAGSDVRAGGGQVRAGEPAQAQPARRRRPAQGPDALDRRACRSTGFTWASLQPWIEHRRRRASPVGTINHGLQVVRRILNLAPGEWMDEQGLTWLLAPPKIKLLPDHDKRQPYPLSWEEQERLFASCPRTCAEMALFAVNTGLPGCRNLRAALGMGGRGAASWHIGVHHSRSPGEERRGASGGAQHRWLASVVDAQRGQHADARVCYEGSRCSAC